MTTDITELARERLKEKFDAWFEREYKHLESSKYTDAVPHIKYGFWMAYQAGVAELVEALEKSEKTSEARREAIDITHKRAARERGRANAAEEALEKAQETIAFQQGEIKALLSSLESRTVTVRMPEPFKMAKSSSGLTYYYADEVNAALTAAGIKWEAE